MLAQLSISYVSLPLWQKAKGKGACSRAIETHRMLIALEPRRVKGVQGACRSLHCGTGVSGRTYSAQSESNQKRLLLCPGGHVKPCSPGVEEQPQSPKIHLVKGALCQLIQS